MNEKINVHENELVYIIKHKGFCYSVEDSSRLSCKNCPLPHTCKELHAAKNTYDSFPSEQMYVSAINLYKEVYGEDKLFEVLL